MTDQQILVFAFAIGGAGVFYSLMRMLLTTRDGSFPERMLSYAKTTAEIPYALLRREYTTAWGLFLALALVLTRVDLWLVNGLVTGAVASTIAAYVGLMVSARANIHTAVAAEQGLSQSLRVAFRGSSIIGTLTASLALVSTAGFLWLVRTKAPAEESLHALLGVALGGVLMSLVSRISGGIYFRLDGRGDLADSSRVHLIGASRAADGFASYLLTLIIAMWLAKNAFGSTSSWVELPLLIGGVILPAGLIGGAFVRIGRKPRIIGSLYRGVLAAILLAGGALYYAISWFLSLAGIQPVLDHLTLFVISIMGLFLLPVIGVITEYYTAPGFPSVRRVAEAAESGAATNVVAGLALGMRSTLLPILAIAGDIIIVYYLGGGFAGQLNVGLYAIGLAAVALVSMNGIIGALNALSPIVGSAHGIATQNDLSENTRQATQTLDTAGQTIHQVARGYALTSTALVSLLMLAGFVRSFPTPLVLDPANPLLALSLLLGGLIPPWLGAHVLRASELAARVSCRAENDNSSWFCRYLGPVTQSFCLRSIPATIILAAIPVVVGLWVCREALAGILLGSLIVGLFQIIALISGGSAWSSARRYIEEGRLGGSLSEAHRAAMTGESVGGHYNDTVGSVLDPMLKTLGLVALLVAPLI
jgi:Na+/H+-translocating membrane pyrophosphatase